VFLCAFGLVLLFSYSLQDIWIEISNRGAFYNLFGGWEAFPHYKSPPWGYRIGGIPDFAAMGILLFLSGYKKINKKITLMALLFFLFCTIISGGRTAFISILMVITLWALFEKKYMIVALLLILFAISIGGIVMFFEYLPGSIKRISNIVGNLENLDTGRSLLFPIFFSKIQGKPIIWNRYWIAFLILARY
jgi:O-antigen ligase